MHTGLYVLLRFKYFYLLKKVWSVVHNGSKLPQADVILNVCFHDLASYVLTLLQVSFCFLWWGTFKVWMVHYTQDLLLKSTHASSQSSGSPLRESQLWKVEQLGKLMAAPGDYRIQERPLFTVSPASPPPGDTEITASLLRTGTEQRPPCPPPKLIPPTARSVSKLWFQHSQATGICGHR